MRKLTVAALLVLLGVTATAQDVTPAEKLKELEERLAKLEKEADDLRREIEKLKGQAPAPPKGALWAFALKSDQKGSAHVEDIDGDGKAEILFGTYFGEEHLYCVDAATGSLRWKHKSDGGPFDAGVAVADVDGDGKKEVLSGDSSNGKLYCLDAKGGLKGIYQLPSGTDSPPAVADLDGDGTLEVIAGSMWQRDGVGAVTCFNGKSREQRWERRLNGCVQSEPVLVDLNADAVLDVIVTTWRGDRMVHALNGKDGSSLWKFETAGDDKSMGMYHGVAVGGEGKSLTVYAATCQGDVYAIDAMGKQVWHKHVDDYLFAPITVADVNADGKDELIFGGHKLYVWSVADGTDLWGPAVVAKGLDRGAAVCDADGDGKLDVVYFDGCKALARDGATGKVVWSYNARDKGTVYEEISSAPVVADFDGNGTLDLFFVVGSGTSTDEFKNNHGLAMALPLKGAGAGWTTFRSNLRRTGNPKHASK